MSDFVYLTREGYEKLTHELEYLKKDKRRQIAKALEKARQMGDLSENAEYDSAKDAQAHNEKRIAELEDTLSRTRIIDDENIAEGEVRVGATVKLYDLDTGEEFSYTLVSEQEADYAQSKISLTSPVGKALLGHKEEDTVEIKAPAKLLRYRILKISRQ